MICLPVQIIFSNSKMSSAFFSAVLVIWTQRSNVIDSGNVDKIEILRKILTERPEKATYGKMLDKFLSYPCWWIKKSKMAFGLQSNLTKCFCFILAADPSTLNVRNFTYNSLNLSTVRIKWEKPIFSESNVTKYDLKYKRRGNPDRKKAFHFEIEEVRPEKVLHTWTDKSGKLPSMLSSQYFGKNFGKRLGKKQTGP